jgi:hypothetical protein
VFELLNLLEKLAAILRPRINLVLYHCAGAQLRLASACVVHGAPPPAEALLAASAPPDANDESTTALIPRY